MNSEIKRQQNESFNDVENSEDKQLNQAQIISQLDEQEQNSFEKIEFGQHYQEEGLNINSLKVYTFQSGVLEYTQCSLNIPQNSVSHGLNQNLKDEQINSIMLKNDQSLSLHNSQNCGLVYNINSTQTKKLTKKQQLSNKKKYSEYLINKHLDGQKLLSTNTKFYIYTDVVIDIDYFKNFSQKESYIKENSLQQIQKGLRFINKIFHRIDNKFIEADLEFFPSRLNDIQQIIYMINSLGDSDLLFISSQLKQMWDIVQEFKLLLKEESKTSLYQQHFFERNQFCEQKCQEIVSQLDPNEMILFYYHVPNYEKCLFESRKVGYSPQLYHILAKDSYYFINYLQENGCCDPRTQIQYQENIVQEIFQCLTGIKLGLMPNKVQSIQKTEIITIDNFIFPVQQIVDVYLLAYEYDKTHGIDLKSQYILSTYTFKFFDQKAYKQFLKFREGKIDKFYDETNENFIQIDAIPKKIDPSQIELIDKYYADSITNLLQQGNKWMKRCGFVDIPKKKQNKQFN